MTKFIRPSLLALAVTLSAPMTAHAGDISISTGVDLVTDYVFRGVSLADTAVQPYVEASTGNFTAGVWISTGVSDTSASAGDEVDLYASYSFELSDKISTDVGVTYYHYPQGGSLFETDDGSAGTYEGYVSLGFDAPLEPSLTAYYDVTLEAFTVEGGISHSIPMSSKSSFDLGANAGLVDSDGFSYEYGGASAALTYAVSDTTSAYLGANLALSSEDSLNYKNLIAGNGKSSLIGLAVGMSTSF
ncbi:MAG: TorF family putative porin [Maricaulaceae bacterium]